MQLVDARRLTGPNLLARRPLVVAEFAFEEGEDEVIARGAYASELGRMRAALGLSPDVEMITRPHRGGAVFAYDAPIDTMLAQAEISEWAGGSAAALLASGSGLELEPKRAEIAAMMEASANPRMLALSAEAKRRGVPFLWDDAAVSVGAGRRSKTFPLAAIPDVSKIAWEEIGTIPIALVTGTNGKTTSARLLARVCREAGLLVGATSTDAIMIDGAVVEEGDWTGPQAARTVLRHAGVEVAVLETARGGILRRGLAADACDVALLTNVTDDHLGGYGIDDLDAMTRVKGIIADAVRPGGTIALNAADPQLAAFGERLRASFAAGEARRVVFFADLDAGREMPAARAIVAREIEAGRDVVITRGGAITIVTNGSEEPVVAADAPPITFGGAARYNVENALGVVAAARGLGIPNDAIVRGLLAFARTDNPGRGELVERGGVRVLLDFGHNPEGVRAVLRLVTRLRAERPGRLSVITGSAGDRSDAEIADVARAVAEAAPDRVIVREMVDYLRGRLPGEVPALLKRELGALGIDGDRFAIVDDEVSALKRCFGDRHSGDFVALLVHLDRAEVRAFLDSFDGK